jgi:hypothetical protein
MNDTIVLLLVIIGGVAGIAIVGVAIWMMRQEDSAGRQEDSAGRQEDSAGRQEDSAGRQEDNVKSSEVSTQQPEDSADSINQSTTTSTTQPEFVEQPAKWVDPGAIETDPSSVSDSNPIVASVGETPRGFATQAPAPDPDPAPPVDPVLSPAPPPPPDPKDSSTQADSPAPNWFNALISRSTTPSLPSATPSAKVEQEILRVLRSADGNLIVEVNGQRYQTRGAIRNERIEQQINHTANDLTSFVTGPADERVKASAPQAANLPPVSLPPKPIAPPRKDPLTDNRPVVKVSLEEAKQMEVQRPTMDVMRQWRYVRDQKLKPAVQIKSVMEEIDEILQALIHGTPLAGRGLKAADSVHGAVFSLDGVNYDAVDDLPDPEARSALRTAIQQWDQK